MTYLNAPIVEAVFDVKVSNTIIINPSTFEKYGKTDLTDYPISNKIFNVQLQISDKQGTGQVGRTTNLLGYVFSNIQGNRKVQFRLDGFSYNMLRPYSNWNDFSTAAFALLKKYIDLAKPNSITRIGLRFINRIDLPLEDQKLEEYIKYHPPIPAGLPKKLDKFFLQMQIPSNDGISKALISQTFERSKGGRVPFIIDIDVFQEERLKITDPLDEKYNALRDLKNSIFEDLITDNCKQFFK